MRKNIFEMAEEKFNLHDEIIKIDDMFSIELNYNYRDSIEHAIDSFYFMSWRKRGVLISTYELRKKCEIRRENLINSQDINEYLRYIEYVLNMLFSFHKQLNESMQNPEIILAIVKNILIVLEKINFEHIICGDDTWIIVEKNPSATAVAEIVKDIKVIEYNHYLLKGDVKGKRDILKLLANKFEEVRPNLNKNNYKDLTDDMGYLFNNLGIRHSDDKLIKDMKPEELEEWYDRTYDMFLLCILANNHVDIRKDIKKLKAPEQAS